MEPKPSPRLDQDHATLAFEIRNALSHPATGQQLDFRRGEVRSTAETRHGEQRRLFIL